MIGNLIGIIYGLYFKKSIAFAFAMDFIIYKLFLLCINVTYVRKPQILKYLKLILNYNSIILFCIFAIISNTYLMYLNKKYENIYDNASKISTKAVVISTKEEKEYSYKYIIKVKSGEYKNKKYVLTIKKDEKNILKYGDLIEFEGEYIAPSKSRNYKGFDYSLYLKSKNIYGTIKTTNCKLVKHKNLNILLLKANDIRNSIIEQANKLLPKENSGLLIGILLGNKEGINEETITNFRQSNLLHLLAVSGAHTSYIVLRYNIYFK